ncbi:unnamed protein product [Urochloa humidicola]
MDGPSSIDARRPVEESRPTATSASTSGKEGPERRRAGSSTEQQEEGRHMGESRGGAPWIRHAGAPPPTPLARGAPLLSRDPAAGLLLRPRRSSAAARDPAAGLLHRPRRPSGKE